MGSPPPAPRAPALPDVPTAPRLSGAITVAALLVLAAGMAAAAWLIRGETRSQIARRDADVLHAIAVKQITDNPADELAAILQASTQRGVLAVRVFNGDGGFVYGFPAHVSDTVLDPVLLTQLRRHIPAGVLHPAFDASSLFLSVEAAPPEPAHRQPLFEVLIPLHRETQHDLLGIAQFLIDGRSLVAEYAALDQTLLAYLVPAYAAGAAVLGGALAWAFRRLARANRLLAERTATLLRANHELTLAAKHSALGAVTAHLVHGLSNPIAGLHHFVQSQAGRDSRTEPTDWHDALSTTQRLRQLVGDVVRVLREHEAGTQYSLSPAEIVQLACARTQPAAAARRIRLTSTAGDGWPLGNRDANLALLILENLLSNAIEASPENGQVKLDAVPSAASLVFTVADSGPGLSPAALAALFTPTTSSKAGGSGIGLAISKQLALQLGATLKLLPHSASGCVFQLSIPAPPSPSTPAS